MLGRNPALTVQQLIDGLQASARPHVVADALPACSAAAPGRCGCSTSTCGAGILDAVQALRYAAAPDGYVAPARQAASVDSRELIAAVALGADLPPLVPDEPSVARGDEAGGAGALGLGWLIGLAAALAALGTPRRLRRA